jgi:outer membrane protein OmpA-like peptidoglycan-associated protein
MLKRIVVSSATVLLAVALSPLAVAAGSAGEVVEVNSALSQEDIQAGLFPQSAQSQDCKEAEAAGFSCGQIVPTKTFSLPANPSFAAGSSRLSDSAIAFLAKFGPVFKRNETSGNKVVFIGHTDVTGSPQLNKRLSQQRANSVRQYFINNFAVSPSFMEAVGVGSAQLLDKSDPSSPSNRRVEIRRSAK